MVYNKLQLFAWDTTVCICLYSFSTTEESGGTLWPRHTLKLQQGSLLQLPCRYVPWLGHTQTTGTPWGIGSLPALRHGNSPHL